MPHTSAVAAPVNGATDGPLAPNVNPEITWGRLFKRSSARAVPQQLFVVEDDDWARTRRVGRRRRDPVTTLSTSGSSDSAAIAMLQQSTPALVTKHALAHSNRFGYIILIFSAAPVVDLVFGAGSVTPQPERKLNNAYFIL